MKYFVCLLLILFPGGPLWAANSASLPTPVVETSSQPAHPGKTEKRTFWSRVKEKVHHLREAIRGPVREATEDLIRLLIIVLIVALIISIVVWLLPWPLNVIILVIGLVALLIFLLRYLV